MKMVVCLIAAGAMALASPAFAQDVKFGAKLGVTFASIPALEDAAEEVLGTRLPGLRRGGEWRTGFIGGGFVRIPVTGMFSVQPEALYAQKGTLFELSSVAASAKISFEIDYLEIPVLGYLSFAPDAMVRPFVFGGPFVGIKTRASAVGEFGSTREDFEGFDELIRSNDAGVAVGGGVEIGRLSVEARYHVGLRDINAEPEPGDPKLKTRAFSVLVGMRFR